MENKWDLTDEAKLLSGILDYGFGNWLAISKSVQPFTPEECESHYMEKFINDPNTLELINLSKSLEDFRNSGNLCSNNCNITLSGDDYLGTPLSVTDIISRERIIRPQKSFENRPLGVTTPRPEAKKTVQSRKKGQRSYTQFTCPGYNAERSGFDFEYDDNAESVLSLLLPSSGPEDIEYDGKEDVALIEALQVAIVKGYNFRLSERVRRKNIIRKHALLDRRKTYSMLQRYEGLFRKQSTGILNGFLEFFSCGAELDLLLERLQIQSDLKLRLSELGSYRREGLRLLASVPLFVSLKEKRVKARKELEAGASVPMTFDSPRSNRRVAAPLTLYNLPGYDLLDDDEKDLCSNVRIVPETYHGFKNLLIAECKRHDGLRLAQARALVKIDVNKTRKMFDFLITRGLIWQPS